MILQTLLRRLLAVPQQKIKEKTLAKNNYINNPFPKNPPEKQLIFYLIHTLQTNRKKAIFIT